MTDLFADWLVPPPGPLRAAEAVDLTTTDHVFTHTTRAIFVSVAGDVRMDLVNSADVTIPLAVGRHDLAVETIYKTGTTATVDYGGW